MFKAGEAFNVIPDQAIIKGTVRSFSREVRMRIHQRIEEICQGLCAVAGASYKLDTVLGFPPVINASDVSAVVAKAGHETLGQAAVQEIQPVMVGEDFSYYLEKVRGSFFLLGTGNPESGLIYPHHHPKFDIDEAALEYGVEIMARAALHLLA
jgi:amidohydrolase